MEAGHIDLALGFLPQLKTAFYQRRLFKQRYVSYVSKRPPSRQAQRVVGRVSSADHGS
jgi:hypothetical protein